MGIASLESVIQSVVKFSNNSEKNPNRGGQPISTEYKMDYGLNQVIREFSNLN